MKPDIIPTTCSIALTQAARYARLGMEAMSSTSLRQAIDVLLHQLSKYPPATLQQCTPLLAELLDAQQRRDFCWFADLIEYRLLPLLLSNKSGRCSLDVHDSV